MTTAYVVTISALIALFAGLYTLVVFTRRRRDAASTTASTPKD